MKDKGLRLDVSLIKIKMKYLNQSIENTRDKLCELEVRSVSRGQEFDALTRKVDAQEGCISTLHKILEDLTDSLGLEIRYVGGYDGSYVFSKKGDADE